MSCLAIGGQMLGFVQLGTGVQLLIPVEVSNMVGYHG